MLVNGLDTVPQELINKFSSQTSRVLSEKLKRERREFTLRFSNIGTPCVRKLWLEKNSQEQNTFRPEVYHKFAFGDLTEEYLLFLAELSGHEVIYRQQKVELEGITGHIDVVIDGMLVDCKSASSNSFKKFKEGLTTENDSFGYLTQLGAYHFKAKELPEVIFKNQAAFLVFDKQHGHIHLDIHDFSTINYSELFKQRKEQIASDTIPDRHFEPVPDGYTKDGEFRPNGNLKLGINCSYCEQKFKCWENIRTFMSFKGPIYFTHIVKEPRMAEIVHEK